MQLSSARTPVEQQLGTFLLLQSGSLDELSALRIPYGPRTLVACVVRYLPSAFVANPSLEFIYHLQGSTRRLHVAEELQAVFNDSGVHTKNILCWHASCTAPSRTNRTFPFCVCGRCAHTWFNCGWQCHFPLLPTYAPSRSLHEGGWIGCAIGLCGHAIVVWVNGLFLVETPGAHCTLFWREQGFDESDKQTIIKLRNTWMARYHRESEGWMNVRLVLADVSATRAQYVLDESELLDFVYYARNQKPDWCEELEQTLVPHVTCRIVEGAVAT